MWSIMWSLVPEPQAGLRPSAALIGKAGSLRKWYRKQRQRRFGTYSLGFSLFLKSDTAKLFKRVPNVYGDFEGVERNKMVVCQQ